MATTGCCCWTFLSLCVFLLNCCSVSDGTKVPPDLNSVKRWASNLDSTWNHWISTLSGYNTVQLKYQAASELTGGQDPMDVRVSFDQVNGQKLVVDMAADLSKMFSKKMDSLRKSVEVAENAAANHVWNGSLENKDVDFYNTNEMQNVDLTYHTRFQQNVNISFSSVHIPVEIFDGDIDILNGLKWTAQLDPVFQDNYEKDDEILWQYFGSQSGFMRTFPASSWKMHGEVDMYDVRRQSWYTQGSSSPKDMMILIDKSGSTHGQALQLMKVAVKSILDTLGENDFVNIVEFSQDAQFVSPCFNHTPFVQANHRNKQRLSKDVDKLSAGGMANFKAGLRFVFEQFKRFGEYNLEANGQDGSRSQAGSACNKVIMLLTDGGTDNAEEIFNEYNWPNKTYKGVIKDSVRVFTYAVGPTANPTTAIRWMACANRGYFSQIPAMGAIRAKVQEYSKVFSKPMEFFNGIEHGWEIVGDTRGLGMMTSVTLPVYNRTVGSSNQTILGVMGIDVTTEALRKRSPEMELGPNGYAFAINPNGYIIFHPNLKPRTYMKDPPDVDLLEIEVETPEKAQLRTKMILEKSETMRFHTPVLTQDMKYIYDDNVTYSFTPIKGTSFSLGISVPSYQRDFPKFVGKLSRLDTNLLKSTSWKKYIAPWEFYKNQSKVENLTGILEDIATLLEADKDVNNWNLQKLFHLYWDVKAVKEAESFSQMIKEKLIVTDGHILSFISTNGGLTQVFTSSENVTFEAFKDPLKEDFYHRTLYSSKYIFLIEPFSKAIEEGNSTYPPDITVVRSVPIMDRNNRIRYKSAVVGMKITYQHVLDQITTASSDRQNTYNCNDSNNIICYLVDDGGFLVASNQEEQYLEVGKFLGQVDPSVMDTLLNVSVYERNKQYDFQGVCYKNDTEVSAGPSSFRIPSLNLLFDALSFNWWSSKLAWAYLNFNLFNIFSTSADDMDLKPDQATYSCNKVMFQYYFGIKEDLHERIICDNCTRNVMVSRIKESTNLLLIVTDPVCKECANMFIPLPQEPVELTVDEEEEVICDKARNPLYRRQTKECYNYDPREDDSKCGCTSLLSVSRIQMLLSYVVMTVTVLMLTSDR